MFVSPALAQTEGAGVAGALVGMLQIALVVTFLIILFRASRAQRRDARAEMPFLHWAKRGPVTFGQHGAREAYGRGLDDLRMGTRVGGREDGLLFLLPYSVCVARDNGFTGDAMRYPDMTS
jgi:hypothetical protein